MKSSIVSGLLTASSLLLSFVSADDAPGTFSVKIVKNRQVERAQLAKRGTVLTTLNNFAQIGLYAANATVGTPPQSFTFQVDTGSSDVWVPSASASICEDTANGGCPFGSFDANNSSTFAVVEKNGFNISYVDGSGSTGDYFTDAYSMSGATLKDFQMGLATDTTIPYGLIGIAYSNSVANVFTGNGSQYPNLVDALVNAGIIATQAYSLWLDDLQATTGQILFGGIDTSKYSGTLSSLKVYPDSRSQNGEVTSFTVAFTSLSVSSSSGTDNLTSSDYAVAAILDSGTSLTLLPDDLAALVFQELGASEDRVYGPVVPCSVGQATGSLSFGFGGSGGPVIEVAIAELVLPLYDQNGKVPHFSNGQAACTLGIEPAQGRPVLFGDTFLRSAYVVYDLVNNRIGIAQSNFNAGSSKIVAFESSGAPIPSATTAQAGAAVTQTATGNPRGTLGATAGAGTADPTAQGSAAGSLSAAGGFGAAATGASGAPAGSSKSAAGAGPGPFAWDAVVVLSASLGMVLVGGGVFAWL